MLFYKEMSDSLTEVYGSDYSIPWIMFPKCIVWLCSFIMFDAKFTLENWNRVETWDTEDTKNILKINFTDVKKSIVEMAQSMIESGYIPDYRKKYKLQKLKEL